jgi:hypothetical protein
LFVYLLGIWEEHRDESEIHASLFYELDLHLKPNKYEGLILRMRMVPTVIQAYMVILFSVACLSATYL